MIAITCDKCRRRFTPTSDEIQVYLAESQGQKHTQVPLPALRQGQQGASERLREAVRFATPAPPPAEDPAA